MQSPFKYSLLRQPSSQVDRRGNRTRVLIPSSINTPNQIIRSGYLRRSNTVLGDKLLRLLFADRQFVSNRFPSAVITVIDVLRGERKRFTQRSETRLLRKTAAIAFVAISFTANYNRLFARQKIPAPLQDILNVSNCHSLIKSA